MGGREPGAFRGGLVFSFLPVPLSFLPARIILLESPGGPASPRQGEAGKRVSMNVRKKEINPLGRMDIEFQPRGSRKPGPFPKYSSFICKTDPWPYFLMVPITK
jgi:hypothetical protein